ncbi:MAG: hypothetical protein PHH21_01625 [Candidatus Pacebacteria bacterium]|nr:hypothetical protein [Candidatus Paceibacterota bacterium]
MFFARTTTLIETIPKNKGIVGQIEFWLLRRRIAEVEREYGLTLGLDFFKEIERWAGKRAFIVFSQVDDNSVKWIIEDKDAWFGRRLERARTIGVGSSHL